MRSKEPARSWGRPGPPGARNEKRGARRRHAVQNEVVVFDHLASISHRLDIYNRRGPRLAGASPLRWSDYAVAYGI